MGHNKPLNGHTNILNSAYKGILVYVCFGKSPTYSGHERICLVYDSYAYNLYEQKNHNTLHYPCLLLLRQSQLHTNAVWQVCKLVSYNCFCIYNIWWHIRCTFFHKSNPTAYVQMWDLYLILIFFFTHTLLYRQGCYDMENVNSENAAQSNDVPHVLLTFCHQGCVQLLCLCD